MVRILVTGGSGFLGQHLLKHLNAEIAYTYNTRPLPAGDVNAVGFQIDLLDEDAVVSVVATFKPDIIVHTAAQSSPAGAAKDPAGTTAVNAPKSLFKAALKAASSQQRAPLLIYISTDQVFSGRSGDGQPYNTHAAPSPVNAYGTSKLEFELMLREQERFSNGQRIPFVILRSSNMIGPPAPFTGATKFLQWLEGKLAVEGSSKNSMLELFHDEIRSFVDVNDVVRTISRLVGLWTEDVRGDSPVVGRRADAVFNMGGPEGLSRVGLALVLGRARPTEFSLSMPDGVTSKVRPISRKALDRQVGYTSPIDLTMDSSELESLVGFRFRPMISALSPEVACAEEHAAVKGALHFQCKQNSPRSGDELFQLPIVSQAFFKAVVVGGFMYVACRCLERAYGGRCKPGP